MSTKQQFQNRGQGTIIERKYLLQVLQDEGEALRQAHIAAIDKYNLVDSGTLRAGPDITISQAGEFGGSLAVRHVKYQRFLDMKTRNTKDGKVRKRNYPIHNKIIFGHLNNIIVKLKYGFTDSVRQNLEQISENHP